MFFDHGLYQVADDPNVLIFSWTTIEDKAQPGFEVVKTISNGSRHSPESLHSVFKSAEIFNKTTCPIAILAPPPTP